MTDEKPRILVVGAFPALRTSIRSSLLQIIVGRGALREGVSHEEVEGLLVVESHDAVLLDEVPRLDAYDLRTRDAYSSPQQSVLQGMREYNRRRGKIRY